MKHSPYRFSILTITFNAEKYLAETLRSTQEQDFSNYEHLIWDGGSKDSTLEIAKQFQHVKVFSGKDGGISDAMNRIASFATGEFLLHLHADDLLAFPKVLSMVDNALRQHPWCKWLYGQTKIIDEEGRLVREPLFVPFNRDRLKKYNIISHPATFIERSLFLREKGFKKELKYCMDYDLWMRLAKNHTALAIPAYLSCFREHSSSLSTTHPLAVATEAYHIRNQYLESFWSRFQSYRTWKRRCHKIQNQIIKNENA